MKTAIIVLILILSCIFLYADSRSILPEMTLGDSLHLGVGIASSIGFLITSIVLPYTFDGIPTSTAITDTPPLFKTAALNAGFLFLAILHCGQAFGPDIDPPVFNIFKIKNPSKLDFDLDFSHLQPLPINPVVDTLIFSEAYLNF